MRRVDLLVTLQAVSMLPVLVLAYWCEDIIFLKVALSIVLLNYIMLVYTVRKLSKYRKMEYVVFASVEGGEDEWTYEDYPQLQ